jgi:hypothetical protein
MNNKLVYRHVNSETLEVFYIGMGNKKRPKAKRGRNRLWNKYVEDNPNYHIDILATDLSYDNACDLEILLIEEYGRENLNTGSLLNMTKGGEGVLDCQTMGDLNPSKRPEVREKLRISSTGERNGMYGRTGESNPFYGKTHTKDHIRSKVVNYSNPVYIYNRNNELINSFECVTDCNNFYNCTNKNILYRIKSKKFGKFGMFRDLLITINKK